MLHLKIIVVNPQGKFIIMSTKNNITYSPLFRGNSILTDKDKQYGCFRPLLSRIADQFEDMTIRHNKVFFMRYDVRFPADTPTAMDNSTFCSFQADFVKQLTRQGLDPHYVVVREQSREKHQHYHGILLLDGNKTQNIYGHIQTAETIWRRKNNLPEGTGLIDACTTSRDGTPQINGVMLRKDDPDYETKKADCFRRASYLAKVNTKANTPEGQRQLFASRIQPKQVKK